MRTLLISLLPAFYLTWFLSGVNLSLLCARLFKMFLQICAFCFIIFISLLWFIILLKAIFSIYNVALPIPPSLCQDPSLIVPQSLTPPQPYFVPRSIDQVSELCDFCSFNKYILVSVLSASHLFLSVVFHLR